MHVIDSHTEGEPTRVIVSGGPDLGDGLLCDRLVRFHQEADHYRRFAINEPRGWDAMVGALLCEPTDPTCCAGVLFFNNSTYLGMCGHGTIGLVVTLHHLRRIGLGVHRIETPVGIVEVELRDKHTASVANVASFRYQSKVSLNVEGIGEVEGDIASGGNWFFLIDDFSIPVHADHLQELIAASLKIKDALRVQGITGLDGAEIDHVEFSQPCEGGEADCVNFVMCPGGAYDRSPCGTGTSAKLACLAADGKLAEESTWIQRSVCGGSFQGTYRQAGLTKGYPSILPTISGSAYICGDTTLIGQPNDPFCHSVLCGAE